jgi:hypothetical protein
MGGIVEIFKVLLILVGIGSGRQQIKGPFQVQSLLVEGGRLPRASEFYLEKCE